MYCDRIYETLNLVDFDWEAMRPYSIEAKVKDGRIELWIDGKLISSVNGLGYSHGMVGVGMSCGGESQFSDISIEEQDK